WAAWSDDDQHVGEARDADAQLRNRTVRPLFGQGHSATALDAGPKQRTGERVEAGGEDDDVELVQLLGGADALRREFDDRMLADIRQLDVVAVERLKVAAVDGRPARSIGKILRHQL